MVALYFGLPGSGKTTMMASIAVRELKKKKRKYQNVYGNVDMAIDGYTYIDIDCIGKYDLSNSLILIDEATVAYNPRKWKEFCDDLVEFFLQHRHMHIDIMLFTQRYDGVDLMIRSITDRVYHLYKGTFTGAWFSYALRIPMDVIIPSRKDSGARVGEIIQGYYKPPFLASLFKQRLYRPAYYKYFDSFQRRAYPSLPKKYTAFKVKYAIPELDRVVLQNLAVSILNHIFITYVSLLLRCDILTLNTSNLTDELIRCRGQRYDYLSFSPQIKIKYILAIRSYLDEKNLNKTSNLIQEAR